MQHYGQRLSLPQDQPELSKLLQTLYNLRSQHFVLLQN
jgi:hypothetical protein